jgi:hypothetical protein
VITPILIVGADAGAVSRHAAAPAMNVRRKNLFGVIVSPDLCRRVARGLHLPRWASAHAKGRSNSALVLAIPACPACRTNERSRRPWYDHVEVARFAGGHYGNHMSDEIDPKKLIFPGLASLYRRFAP